MKIIVATLLFALMSFASAAEINNSTTFHALQNITGHALQKVAGQEHAIAYLLPMQDSQLASVEGGLNINHFLKFLRHQLKIKHILGDVIKINRTKIINRRIVHQTNVCGKPACNSQINRLFLYQKIR